MQVSENKTCLWTNCAFQVSANSNIVLKRDVCQVTDSSDVPDSTEQNVSEHSRNNDLIAVDYGHVAIGMLVFTIMRMKDILEMCLKKKSN